MSIRSQLSDLFINAVADGEPVSVTDGILIAYWAAANAAVEDETLNRLPTCRDSSDGGFEALLQAEFVEAFVGLLACEEGFRETARQCWTWPESLPRTQVPVHLAVKAVREVGRREGREAWALRRRGQAAASR
jgi:hypothetical protein